MKLTADQENIIKAFVDAQGLKIKTLSEDITDHLCCVVESQLGKGKSFEDLLDKAIMDLAPNGLIEIQHKTIFLLKCFLSYILARTLHQHLQKRVRKTEIHPPYYRYWAYAN